MSANTSERAVFLAEQVRQCKVLLGRYLAGFTDVTCVRGTPDLPNHAAWCLGHCAVTMHRFAEKLDGRGLPTSDFVVVAESDGTHGSREKGVFDAEGVAFGSVPSDRHDRFPTLARATEIYNAACDRLAGTLEGLSDARLEETVVWGNQPHKVWAVATRLIFHNGFHTGQIADLRRALGMRSIFG
jgi:hypothetical protein